MSHYNQVLIEKIGLVSGSNNGSATFTVTISDSYKNTQEFAYKKWIWAIMEKVNETSWNGN